MTIKRRLPPDTRPDWRDPEMPVIRDYKMPDGTTKEYVTPEFENRYRAYFFPLIPVPTWKEDPTYNLRRPRGNKT